MSSSKRHHRQLPIGAEVLAAGGVHFRVWAPRRKAVSVVLEGNSRSRGRNSGTAAYSLEPNDNGYFSGLVAEAHAGSLYRLRLDDGDTLLLPDPASRFQPQGPEGPSQVIDPASFEWSDGDWPGLKLPGQVIYEMHIGTFTREGTWRAAAKQLEALAQTGITVLEVMPVAEFAGEFGWGYDGVDWYAPTRLYGTPDDFRYFVDRAHALGLGVILDVVYNHLGPVGNFLREFSIDYFTDRYETDWGEAFNLDGDGSGPVREIIVSNAVYWIREFHLDGLRLDATQSIIDRSPKHILAVLAKAARNAAGKRSILILAENEPQLAALARPSTEKGFGLDALWNDDFHHSAMVALTGRNEAYYSNHRGAPQEFISAAKWGYLYQGQYYNWQRQRRGTPTFGLPPAAFVNYIQNHDQVANSARGLRAHQLTSPGRYRAMTALLLLVPGTPMLFQGQEFGASTPFCYFADHPEPLASAVREGRKDFLRQFISLDGTDMEGRVPDPVDVRTFQRCKLDHGERERHAEATALHRDLLALRRRDAVFRAQRADWMDGAVLGPEAFALRFLGGRDGDRLLLVNLGRDLVFDPAPEPLLAPPEDSRWEILWSSEWASYGGRGAYVPDTEEGWRIPGHAAVVLAPKRIARLHSHV